MQFTADKKSIQSVLLNAGDVSGDRGQSVLSCVLITAQDSGKVKVEATDLKIGYIGMVSAVVDMPGVVAVPCKKLLDTIKVCPDGELTFTHDGHALTIKPEKKKVSFTIPTMEAGQYPEFGIEGESKEIELSSANLVQMIEKTEFSVSDDEARFFMNGVYFHKAGAVSTDGRRLSWWRGELPIEAGYIVPVRGLNMVRKACDGLGMVKVKLSDKRLQFNVNGQVFTISTTDGTFPNYRRVIPESQLHNFTVDKAEIKDAIKRCAVYADKSRRLILDIGDHLTLLVESDENGKITEEIAIQGKYQPCKIALNVNYLSDIVSAVDGQDVTFEYTEPGKAVTVNDGCVTYIAMPMMLND